MSLDTQVRFFNIMIVPQLLSDVMLNKEVMHRAQVLQANGRIHYSNQAQT
jgi:hypothetical protein